MISIIIPTYNEADQIAQTISTIQKARNNHNVEIIVVDGGSNDETISIAADNGAIVCNCTRKGRASQMNEGAALAKNGIFYFLHADSIPPDNFTGHILEALDQGYSSGCFKLNFDFRHWFLKANSWFTKFDVNAVRFGDQSLFVTRQVFQNAGGFDERLFMMEDQEIIHRVKRYGKFKVMNDFVITSARKYLDNGIFRMQWIFYRIWFLYYAGYSQEYLLQLHRKLIRKHKL